MAVILSPPHHRLPYQTEQLQKDIATLLVELLFMLFYHVDESVKSNPSKSRGVITVLFTMFTPMWKDTVN